MVLIQHDFSNSFWIQPSSGPASHTATFAEDTFNPCSGGRNSKRITSHKAEMRKRGSLRFPITQSACLFVCWGRTSKITIEFIKTSEYCERISDIAESVGDVGERG